MITTTVLKFAKSITFVPKMHVQNSTRKIRIKTDERLELATHRLLVLAIPFFFYLTLQPTYSCQIPIKLNLLIKLK